MNSSEVAPPRRGRDGEVLAEFPQEELIAKWEEFFDEMGYGSRIIAAADRYPETRSLEVPFDEVNRFDTDMAIYLLRHPLNVLTAGEEAIRRLSPPGDEGVQIHLRIKGLPRDHRVQIRDLRAKHLGQYVAVEGLVRKSTEVRPRVVGALFQCLRCGTILKEEQEGQAFREPLECYQEQGGCGRSASATKFKLLTETSLYLDTQKLEVQEAPEGLRGGAEPQRLSAYVEDDLTGRITPGMRVVLNGVLRSVQRGRPGARSTLFDIFLDVNSIEFEQVEFEEIEVTEEDARKIREIGSSPDIFRLMVNSIAPSIYGMHMEKEALALQLFSGVPKVLPDGRRIRGDLHLLLVGDPGCLVGDERIVLGNGTIAKLESLGRRHLEPIREQVRLGAGRYRNGWATCFHRYEDEPVLEVLTETGKCIKGTRNHPLLVWNPSSRTSEWKRLDELSVGDRLRVTHSIKCWKQALVPTGWEEPRYFHKSWHVKVPKVVDEELAAILGYVVGDGWVQERRVGYLVAEGELDLAARLDGFFERTFGVRPRRGSQRGKVVQYQVDRTPIARWLRDLAVKRVPEKILRSRNSVVGTFLRWLFEADGSCFTKGRGRTAISLRSAEIELLRDVQVLLLRWGIHSAILWGRPPRPHVHDGKKVGGRPSGSLVIRRTDAILRYARYIGFASAKKKARLEEVAGYVNSRSRRRRAQISERIVSIRSAGQAVVFDIEVPGSQRFIANGIISHNTAKSELLSYMSRLSPRGIYATGKAASAAGLCVAGESLLETPSGPRPIEEIVQAQFRNPDRLDTVETTAAVGFVATYDYGEKPVMKPLEAVWRMAPPPALIEIQIESGRTLLLTPATKLMVSRSMGLRWVPSQFVRPGMRVATADSPVVVDGGFVPRPRHWSRVSNIRVVPADGRANVYDLTVGAAHAFMANGILVHNTAAAVRDEFGEGRWTLEAGALVLADKGLACIDEIEKMNPQDRSAIHEALEQQRISVAKAGITAVLQARCAVLAAANPQFGRFDVHKYISEQIQLEPPLLSRFDGIFAIIDRPESEKDRALAEHVLRGHKVGEILRRRQEGLPVAEERILEAPYTPHFDPDFLRKYVAYAKRLFPVMTDEAMEAMERKYLEIRKLGEGAGASVPITPRQLESIIRFAEASARLRLSETVAIEDVDRSIRVVEYWMGKVAGEEGGRLDIDIIQTGISQSQREQIIALRDIINELAGPEGVADYEDIVRVAQERGVPPARVDAWLKRWAQEGDIYSPAKNKYKLVERL